jgi:hypothetical protein
VLEVAALVVALALGETKATAPAEARSAMDASNTARARIGLLPRKAPARTGPLGRSVRRVSPASRLAPTFLGEPGTLAEGPESPEPAPPQDRARLRLRADGVTTDVTISMRFDPE